jgi:cytochrome c oxidase assembly protein subunit 15
VRRPTISPTGFRHVTIAALLALVFIIVTGGAVRVTESGLGCPEWPNCDANSLTPRDASDLHGMVEFVNRTITGLVSVAVIVAVLGSHWRRPFRRDLVWLSWGLVAGVAGQIVLGGLTVLYDLAPPLVMAHFLLSLLLVADALVLHWRAGIDDRAVDRLRPTVDEPTTALGRVLPLLAAVAVVTGTVVTGTGPHGGDAEAPRFGFTIHAVARVHGAAVVVFGAVVLVLLRRLHVTRAPAEVQRRARLLVTAVFLQAVVGYTQYFTDVPALLVAVHILGAVLVWSATVWFVLGLKEPVPVPD